MIGIYKITSPSDKIYIGQSIQIEKRFNNYHNLNRVKGQIKLYNSFIKYGVENHKFEILTLCYEEQLNELERDFQEAYDVIGKNGLNCRLTETYDKSGKMSNESIEKLKKSRKGIIFSEEHKSNLRKSRANHITTDSTKFKLSQNNKTSKKVINVETNEIYHSIRYAAKCTGIHYKTLTHWVMGTRKNKSSFQLFCE